MLNGWKVSNQFRIFLSNTHTNESTTFTGQEHNIFSKQNHSFNTVGILIKTSNNKKTPVKFLTTYFYTGNPRVTRYTVLEAEPWHYIV